MNPSSLDPLDPGIAETIRLLNSLGFLETLFSCAGFGLSGATGREHGRDDCPYLFLRYTEETERALSFHHHLEKIANSLRRWTGNRCSYYFVDYSFSQRQGLDDVQQANRRQWERVRDLAREFSGVSPRRE